MKFVCRLSEIYTVKNPVIITKIFLLCWIFEDDPEEGVYEYFHVPRLSGATPGPKTPDSWSSWMYLYVKKI